MSCYLSTGAETWTHYKGKREVIILLCIDHCVFDNNCPYIYNASLVGTHAVLAVQLQVELLSCTAVCKLVVIVNWIPTWLPCIAQYFQVFLLKPHIKH